MAAAPKKLAVRLLAPASDYRRAALAWYEHIEQNCAPQVDLRQQPVYFVSSNTHSLINLLSGFALRRENCSLHSPSITPTCGRVNDIEARHVPSSRENFLTYVLKKPHSPEGAAIAATAPPMKPPAARRIPSARMPDVDAQVMELRRLRPDWLDPRLHVPGMEKLSRSQAVILNIDYPLGMAAYLILTQVAARVGEVRGLYVMGKAATLNGAVGDVMMPNVIYDEQSHNTYLFENSLSPRMWRPIWCMAPCSITRRP
jgi:hypothetical protein